MMRERGVTLLELMSVVTIMGILAAMALPGMRRYMDRSYWEDARDLLLTIHDAEQEYFDLNGTYRLALGPGSSMTAWREIWMDNPNLGSIPVQFATLNPIILAGIFGPATGFRALACNPALSPCTKWMWIDANGLWCGGPTVGSCTSWPKP